MIDPMWLESKQLDRKFRQHTCDFPPIRMLIAPRFTLRINRLKADQGQLFFSFN